MDVSIVAAVGSFIVSERVIKAKATVLFGLLCVVCYDLSIHSNDPISLRVYRGPGIFAISLICLAFCLRSWRRNGVACDELLFLPGSVYAGKSDNGSSTPVGSRLPLNLRHTDDIYSPVSNPSSTPLKNEKITDDIENSNNNNNNSNSISINKYIDDNDSDDNDAQIDMNSLQLQQSVSLDSTTAEIQPLKLNAHPTTNSHSSLDSEYPTIPFKEQIVDEDDIESLESRRNMWSNITQSCRKRSFLIRRPSQPYTIVSPVTNAQSNSSAKQESSKFLGRYFSSSEDSTTYAPSGPSVAGAAVDLCMPVLFNFHMFMMATHGPPTEADDENKGIPPQVLPLIFLSILFLKSILPRARRKRFWATILETLKSPLCEIKFRDEIIGDVLTSFVRPLQDHCFAIFYYFAAMYGIYSGKSDLEDIGNILSRNFVLHNIVLPTCAVLPLLFRFLQTLRQSYDSKRRWPHLGNAFKYLSASLVIYYGMSHSERQRTHYWRLAFAICTIYQIWWDTFIDWELFTIIPKDEMLGSQDSRRGCCSVFHRMRLRPKRLFKSDRSYWRIFFFNLCFRFTWMLSFIPTYHLSLQTGDIETTFSMDVKTVVGFVVSLTEVIRRSCWLILKLELETIKMSGTELTPRRRSRLSSSRIKYTCLMPKELRRDIDTSQDEKSAASSHTIAMKKAAYHKLVRRVFGLELIIWIGIYIALSLWTAALI